MARRMRIRVKERMSEEREEERNRRKIVRDEIERLSVERMRDGLSSERRQEMLARR